MKLIVGLGNPGTEYQKTRHNAGFAAVSYYAKHIAPDSSWKDAKKFHSQICQTSTDLLAKPQTFMNDSGEAVQALRQFYKITNLHDLWVIHDDLDLELGKYKIQLGTGPKIHNGLGSIYQHLGSKDFWHVRIGVDSRQGDRTLPGHAYVLQAFTAAEWSQLSQVFSQITAELQAK